MGCLEPVKTSKGHYMAMFHDDGRFFTSQAKQEKPVVFTLFKNFLQGWRPDVVAPGGDPCAQRRAPV